MIKYSKYRELLGFIKKVPVKPGLSKLRPGDIIADNINAFRKGDLRMIRKKPIADIPAIYNGVMTGDRELNMMQNTRAPKGLAKLLDKGINAVHNVGQDEAMSMTSKDMYSNAYTAKGGLAVAGGGPAVLASKAFTGAWVHRDKLRTLGSKLLGGAKRDIWESRRRFASSMPSYESKLEIDKIKNIMKSIAAKSRSKHMLPYSNVGKRLRPSQLPKIDAAVDRDLNKYWDGIVRR